MKIRGKMLLLLTVALSTFMWGCDSTSLPFSPSSVSTSGVTGETINPIQVVKNTAEQILGTNDNNSLKNINGVELMSIQGWFANIYPWDYDRSTSTVHPVNTLWTEGHKQTPYQIVLQNEQLNAYGSEADVLEFNVAPGNPDFNHWLRVYFSNSNRPFFILYEHVFGNSNYTPHNGPKNMNVPQNRKAFMDDIEFIYKYIILANERRYVTVNGRAVIYMWSTSQMTGDFASLIIEAKNKYPVFFIGTEGIPETQEDKVRINALDGFMEYSLGGSGNYIKNIQGYHRNSLRWRQYLRQVEAQTGRRQLLIPTFQAAYDDTKVPGRNNVPTYPRTKQEIEYHAQLIKSGMGTIYDNIGPFVVYSELPEGAAVIESQCTEETMNRPNRYTGCGLGRLEILKSFFGVKR